MGRGFGIEQAVPADVVRQVAAEVEALGYTSFWVNNPPGTDGLASLAAAASVTERIRLGVGVIPIDRHPPAEVVARVEQHGLPVDRLWLGIGSGGDQRGLSRVRQAIDELHGAGAFSVVISALGPKMTRLAGEAADGVLFNWFTAAYARQAAELVGEAAAQAGRTRPRVMAYVRTGLLPQAREKLGERANRYGNIPQYARHFERMNVSAADTCVSASDAETLQAGIGEHEQVLDETIVRAITPNDSLSDLLELVRSCSPHHNQPAVSGTSYR